ncbi:serine/threonine protein kinase [Myxococcota bacterium]|nr:serine/threonine protein kinase [Myxococcota bacterium]MBU1382276.1 serine/threonine protein kinase [Myxococcota bacterium]MBU1498140.1 serine/threonine protein kinase [Myxococcota bacterium]
MLNKIGKYELIEEVGRGGMAVVYRAKDSILGRQVALKLLHPYLAEDHQAKIRLESEARAVASLHHPLIPEVYDFSGHDSEHAYIVTEYVDGVTLAKFLKQNAFDLPECALVVFHRIVTALDHAHKTGIVHRDLKPENIMITGDGEIRLMDFGISRVVENPGITSTGQILGSPAYMAPEIVRGQIADEKSDIFACGILIYQMTTGCLPFTGTNPHAVLVKIAETEYEDPEVKKPEIGTRVSRFIRRLLSKNPEDRPQNTSILLKETEALLADSNINSNEIIDLSRKVITRGTECEKKLKPRVINSLIKLTRTEGNSALAHQTINRLLCIAPDNSEVKLLWENIYADDNRFKFKPAIVISSLITITVLIIAIFIFLNRNRTKPDLFRFSLYYPDTQVLFVPQDKDLISTDIADPDADTSYSYVPILVNDATQLAVNSMVPMDKKNNGHKPPVDMKQPVFVKNGTPVMPADPMMESALEREFTIFPFPQGKVKVYLDNKFLGFWGPSPGISSVRIGNGKHAVKLTHPLCYSKTITIPENMKSGRINVRLNWKPARLIVEAPEGSVVAVKTLEGNLKTLPGIPGAPIEVVFPQFWDKSNIRVKVIVASGKFRTKEKNITLMAGRLMKMPFESFD